MVARVLHAIERHGLLLPGQRLGVAVSGGADSVCLLHVLVELVPRFGWRLFVLHLDHGLRGAASRADAAFVRDLAARHGLPFVLREAGLQASVGNLEQAGRQARMRFFREMIESGCVDRVATAHTRSDQAETVLFRFLRGAGTAGLAGIRPVVEPGIVRPMLDVNRTEVLQFLREDGLEWREDATNSSQEFARNRLRHNLLPALEREWNPNLPETLAHTAEVALEEEAYWASETDRLLPAVGQWSGTFFLADVAALRPLPPAVLRRLVRRAIEKVRGGLRAIDFRHVESVLRLIGRSEGHGACDLPGVRVERSFNWVRFVEAGRPPARFRIATPAPGCVHGGGLELRLDLIEKSETSEMSDSVYNDEMGSLDWRHISGALEWRNWEPGDRYSPIGSTADTKLKSLFQAARIPHWDRSGWPILTCGGSIVWVRRFGPAVGYEPGPETRVLLRIRVAGGGPVEIGIGTGQGGV